MSLECRIVALDAYLDAQISGQWVASLKKATLNSKLDTHCPSLYVSFNPPRSYCQGSDGPINSKNSRRRTFRDHQLIDGDN